jgi:Tol biopolymer transport system component
MSRDSGLLVRAVGAAALLAVGVAGWGGEDGTSAAAGKDRSAVSTAAPWRLVYASEVAGRRGLDIYVVAVPGGKPRRVAGVPRRNDFSPSWSPDGRTIAYRLNPVRGDEGEIMVVPARGGKARNLTKSPGVADWSPVWHPSGQTIAFFSFPGRRGDIWLMRRDGKRKRRLTRDGTLNEYPTFSPDGKRVAFQSHRGGDFDIYVIAGNGRERNLTMHPARDQWAAWSPDGEWIAFMSERDGGEDVFVMRPDGSGVRNLTRTTAFFESHPAWAPDRRLTFSRHGDSGPISLWAIDPEGTAAEQLDTVAEPVFTYDWLER